MFSFGKHGEIGDVKSCFILLYVGKVWGPSLGSIGIKRDWKMSGGELRSFQTGLCQSIHRLTCTLRRLLMSYTMEPVLQPHGHRGLWGGIECSPQPKGLSFLPSCTNSRYEGTGSSEASSGSSMHTALAAMMFHGEWGHSSTLNPATLASWRVQVVSLRPSRSVMVPRRRGRSPGNSRARYLATKWLRKTTLVRLFTMFHVYVSLDVCLCTMCDWCPQRPKGAPGTLELELDSCEPPFRC